MDIEGRMRLAKTNVKYLIDHDDAPIEEVEDAADAIKAYVDAVLAEAKTRREQRDSEEDE